MWIKKMGCRVARGLKIKKTHFFLKSSIFKNWHFFLNLKSIIYMFCVGKGGLDLGIGGPDSNYEKSFIFKIFLENFCTQWPVNKSYFWPLK